MFRLWGRTFRDNHMLADIVIENGSEDTRTHKVFDGLEKICYAFDLSKPIWLDSVIADFQRTSDFEKVFVFKMHKCMCFL